MTTRAQTKAMENGRQLARLMDEKSSTAHLYRTWFSGTASGMLHGDVYVGTLRWAHDDDIPSPPDSPLWEFSVSRNPSGAYWIEGWVGQTHEGWHALREGVEGWEGVSGVFDSAAKAVAAITGR